MFAETLTPIANGEMKPNSKPLVQQQPAVHGPRQQLSHVLARRSNRLDPGNYPSVQPAAWLEVCHLNWAPVTADASPQKITQKPKAASSLQASGPGQVFSSTALDRVLVALELL